MASSWTFARRAATALAGAKAATCPRERERLIRVAAELDERAQRARIAELEHQRRQSEARRREGSEPALFC